MRSCPRHAGFGPARLVLVMAAGCLVLAACVAGAGVSGSDGTQSVAPVPDRGLPALSNDLDQPLTSGYGQADEIGGWTHFDGARRKGSGVTVVTARVEVCLRRPTAVRIYAIEPVAQTGDVSSGGVFVHDATSDMDLPLSDSRTVERIWGDDVAPAVGAGAVDFTQVCDPDQPSEAKSRQGLFLTLRSETPVGGEWRGLAVTYTDSDLEEHVLQVPFAFGICGTSVPICRSARRDPSGPDRG